MDYHIMNLEGGGRVVKRFRKIRNAEGKWLQYNSDSKGHPIEPGGHIYWDSREEYGSEIRGSGDVLLPFKGQVWADRLKGCTVYCYEHHEVVTNKFSTAMFTKEILK